MDKDKRNTLILIIMGILVLIICICIGIFYNTNNEKTVILVKDLQSEEHRVISDKTDGLSKGKEDLVIKAETPDGLLNPDEVFKNETPDVNVEDNTEGRTDTIVLPKVDENPLSLVPPDSDVDIIREEVIEEKVKEDTNLNDLLEEARKKRNEGREEVSRSFAFLNTYGDYDTINDLCYEKGVILIPFSISEDNLDYLKSWERLYKKYSNSVQFVFLNTSFEGMEIYRKVLDKFKECSIDESYPVFYDLTWDFVLSKKITDDIGYLLINSDSFQYKRGNISEDISNLDIEIDAMLAEIKLFKAEDAQIRSQYAMEHPDSVVNSQEEIENSDKFTD